ncbi:MAG TPA: FAD-dependent monooxygenase [Pseudonocardiaceae bacterium]|jgi:2-polyprenyl-6-methoxyphenol hydroxylase-like FAD-dependent oxidoreductase
MTDNSSLRGLRVLISGAGVAGPALAYWLTHYGATVTVVEVAPALRTSGFAVDFRGPTHLGVLEKMGVLDDLRAVQTHAGAMSWVDKDSREIFRLPVEFAGGEVELRRRDLSGVLYDHSAERAEYVFGDTITNLTEAADGIEVDFAHAASRTIDLVVGADGLHSAVRRIAFGPESRYVEHLGYYLAGWDLPNDLGADDTARIYNEPGRMASVSADLRDPTSAGAFFVFASPQLDYDRHDLDQQKKLIVDAFTGQPWHVPHLLDSLREVSDLYFDSISRVSVPNWWSGRVALLGDAGFGVTLGGMGVGTGVVGAYVLAGELAVAAGDHRVAFPAYQQRLHAYATRWQRHARPGGFLAPATATGLALRNAMFRRKFVRRLLVGSSHMMATDLDLPEY